MSDDIPDSALAESSSSDHINHDIPDAALAYGDSTEAKPKAANWWDKYKGFQESQLSGATGIVGGLAGGLSYLGRRLEGGTEEEAQQERKDVQTALTYKPRTEEGQRRAAAMEEAGQYLGPKEGQFLGSHAADLATRLGAPPEVAGVAGAAGEVAGNVGTQAAIGGGLTGLGKIRPSAQALIEKAPAEAAVPAIVPTHAFDSAPVEGGLPDTAQTARAEVLQRIGLDKARSSALSGNAKEAATDFQLSRFDEPAGIEAKAQFDNEKAALRTHAENIVDDTRGTLGTDEDTLNTRGQTIAKPFDQLEDWFDAQRKSLYGEADKRAGGSPVTNLEGVDALLGDPKFKNTLLAKDQGGLLNSIQSQLAEFRKQSPEGFTVSGAEQFRQWLNEIWTNDNKAVIGKVKSALDGDVLKGAGEDIYGPARALEHMRHQTLDNPNGISRLMDHDPQTPINRTTPYVKIPDTLSRLDPDQFNNVLKTLDTMPEEIQPAARAAKAEIKAHLANKLYDAGTSTQGQWNAPAVSKIIKANSAKLQAAFADQPEVLSKIQDLDSAGRILKVNQSYPGAAAQAANALKRGFMSRAVSKASSATGALAGSALGGVVAGPVGASLGAGAGAAGGEALGSSLGQGMAERSAVTRWNQGTVPLSELLRKRVAKK